MALATSISGNGRTLFVDRLAKGRLKIIEQKIPIPSVLPSGGPFAVVPHELRTHSIYRIKIDSLPLVFPTASHTLRLIDGVFQIQFGVTFSCSDSITVEEDKPDIKITDRGSSGEYLLYVFGQQSIAGTPLAWQVLPYKPQDISLEEARAKCSRMPRDCVIEGAAFNRCGVALYNDKHLWVARPQDQIPRLIASDIVRESDCITFISKDHCFAFSSHRQNGFFLNNEKAQALQLEEEGKK